MSPTTPQEQFPSNDKNTPRLISLLHEEFEKADYVVKQVDEDADCLIF